MEVNYNPLIDRSIKKTEWAHIILFAMLGLICISVVGMNVFLGMLYTELGHLHTSVDMLGSFGSFNQTDIANAFKCIGTIMGSMCHM